jgi:hypothetical protein
MINLWARLVGVGLLCVVNVVWAQEPVPETPWQETKNAEGIQVFSRHLPDDPVVQVKAVTVIDAAITRIVDVLDNHAEHPKWVPYLKESRVLQSFSATEKLIYNHFDAPWPATDRDYVYRVHFSQNGEGVITYTMKSEETALMPEQPGIVRAQLLEGIYTLVPTSETQTKVEFSFYADPRGHLPGWLEHIVQRNFPYNSLRGLRELMTVKIP